MTSKKKYKVRFFFEYGSGGCLWANDDHTLNEFENGPIDLKLMEKGILSEGILDKIQELDNWHASYLNQEYPPDPSPWRQAECDKFNNEIEELLQSLLKETEAIVSIKDEQPRYKEDPDLDLYLEDPKSFRRE